MNAHGAIGVAAGSERFEIVTTSERLAEIGPAWTSLWQRADGLIFQSADWVQAWWETLPDQREYRLHICLLWQADTLLGVAPFAISRRRGVRMLEWAARSYSDYCDIVVDPDCSSQALARLWQELSRSSGFDLVFLNRLLPDAVAQRMFGAASGRGIRTQPNRREEVSCRVTGEWTNGAAWVAAQPKKTRQEYRRHHRILSEMGSVTLRTITDIDHIDGMLRRFMELKRLNLAASNKESPLFEEESRTLRAQASAMHRAGIMHLFVLECGGKPIAFSLNFLQHKSMMAYVTTYDPAFSRGSPGDVLIMEYIQWAIDNGCHTVDFLCGGERFKNKFSTEVVTLRSVAATATLKGAIVQAIDKGLYKLRNRVKADNS